MVYQILMRLPRTVVLRVVQGRAASSSVAVAPPAEDVAVGQSDPSLYGSMANVSELVSQPSSSTPQLEEAVSVTEPQPAGAGAFARSRIKQTAPCRTTAQLVKQLHVLNQRAPLFDDEESDCTVQQCSRVQTVTAKY